MGGIVKKIKTCYMKAVIVVPFWNIYCIHLVGQLNEVFTNGRSSKAGN